MQRYDYKGYSIVQYENNSCAVYKANTKIAKVTMNEQFNSETEAVNCIKQVNRLIKLTERRNRGLERKCDSNSKK